MKVHNIDVYADGYRTYSNGTKRPVYQCTYCDKVGCIKWIGISLFLSPIAVKNCTDSQHLKKKKSVPVLK